MQYTLKYAKDCGFEARWGKNAANAVLLFIRLPTADHDHQRNVWWAVDAHMWAEAQRVGLATAFEQFTSLGDLLAASLESVAPPPVR